MTMDLGPSGPRHLYSVEAAVARAFREEWGRVVATLIRTTGDWDLAEEYAQDAFALALERWPRDGVPRRPGAWLTTAARHRAIDRLRNKGHLPKLIGIAFDCQEVASIPAEPHDVALDAVLTESGFRHF